MTPDEHEPFPIDRLMERLAAETLPPDVDPERLEGAVRDAVGSHPDRSVIVGLLMLEASAFIVRMGDEIEVRLGFWDGPALVPRSAQPGEYITLGRIPVAQVLRRGDPS